MIPPNTTAQSGLSIVATGVLVVLFCGGLDAARSGNHTGGGGARDVGTVQFPVSTAPGRQQEFNRAIAMLHSFWYEEVDKAFSGLSNQDPSCGMAFWGVAMSLYHPLWQPPDRIALRRGWGAVQKAKALGAPTERERDYISAIEVFYKDFETLDHRTRAQAYSDAMEKLHRKYPDDREGAIFYALSLIATAPRSDKTYAKQKAAAEILNRVSIEKPDHPGVIHYIIHAYDSPALAHLGLDAARRYAQIAPAVPHALHMPSHIFTRLGLWEEAIHSNRDCVSASREYARKLGVAGVWDEQIHAMDYLMYAYMQIADDEKAKSIAEEAAQIREASSQDLKVAYPLVTIPGRYALERHRWAEAATMEPAWSDFPWERFPNAEGVLHFVRGLGAARSGDVTSARKELAQLEQVSQRLSGANQQDWSAPAEVGRLAVKGWIAHAVGDSAEAERVLRQAANLEDGTEKHPVTPGPVLPARELLGEFLLEAQQFTSALQEFRASLLNAPNRFNSLYGAARAAEQSGDRQAAAEYYGTLVRIGCKTNNRPEFRHAEEFLASGARSNLGARKD
jgi:tetratricopeptide (TPR) repeat protein